MTQLHIWLVVCVRMWVIYTSNVQEKRNPIYYALLYIDGSAVHLLIRGKCRIECLIAYIGRIDVYISLSTYTLFIDTLYVASLDNALRHHFIYKYTERRAR